jgi:cell pole-organizing protein PopZ
MNQPARSQEPSMEEILASIRRIIADDDASKTAQRPPEAPRAEAPPLPPLPPLQEIPEVFAAPPPRPAPPPPAPPPRIEFEPPPPPPPVVEEPVAFHQETVADQSADILDLTESMTAALDSSPPVPQFRTIDGSSDVGFDEAQEATELPPPPLPDLPSHAPFPQAAPRLHDDQGRLISGATSAAVDSAFNALAQTVLSQNARTLEDLVREMLRPMLKSWLDDNLPGMVERMVRAEIERVSRGRPG